MDYLKRREDGRYVVRVVVPERLQSIVGQKSFERAVGRDPRAAQKRAYPIIAKFQAIIHQAERELIQSSGQRAAAGTFPLTVDQMAWRHYQELIAYDDEIRNQGPAASSVLIDDQLVAKLRDGIAGRLSDYELAALVGRQVEHFRRQGNTTAEFGTDEWRLVARGMCISEYEALSRMVERDEGDFSGKPSHPMLATAKPAADEMPPVSLTGLLDDYIDARKLVGKGGEAAKRWMPVFRDLRDFLKHDDARRLTKQNLLEWRDLKLTTLAAKTVSDVYLASVRTVLSWAVANDRLEVNVASAVRQDVPKKRLSREKGFTLAEAEALLKASRNYVPAVQPYASITEAEQTTAAKRWAPILCAFTGARVAEITQLRKQDIRMEGDIPVLRITPDAGTVKAGGYRDVPIHPQIVALGFLDFVAASADGPLFYLPEKARDAVTGAQTVAARVGRWLQGLGVIPKGVSPNHGWRHRFKTVGQEQGISDRTLDAIQGHAGKTAGDSYGDVTLKARKTAIDSFPAYKLN